MTETCYSAITWFQSLTALSVMLNVFLGGVVAVCAWEVRAARRSAESGRPLTACR